MQAAMSVLQKEEHGSFRLHLNKYNSWNYGILWNGALLAPFSDVEEIAWDAKPSSAMPQTISLARVKFDNCDETKRKCILHVRGSLDFLTDCL